MEKWLGKNVEKTARIGADPRMLSYSLWSTWDTYLGNRMAWPTESSHPAVRNSEL